MLSQLGVRRVSPQLLALVAAALPVELPYDGGLAAVELLDGFR